MTYAVGTAEAENPLGTEQVYTQASEETPLQTEQVFTRAPEETPLETEQLFTAATKPTELPVVARPLYVIDGVGQIGINICGIICDKVVLKIGDKTIEKNLEIKPGLRHCIVEKLTFDYEPLCHLSECEVEFIDNIEGCWFGGYGLYMFKSRGDFWYYGLDIISYSEPKVGEGFFAGSYICGKGSLYRVLPPSTCCKTETLRIELYNQGVLVGYRELNILICSIATQ